LRAIVIFAILATQAYSASVQGSIRDSQGIPIAQAAIHLQAKTAPEDLIVRSDANGTYSIPSLRRGTYTLRAVMTNFSDAVYGPFELGPDEIKKVDLVLKAAPSVEFFDEPKFNVAGVTNYSYFGGHGSEPVKRSNEALVKETASLGKDAPASREPHHALAEEYEKAGSPLEAVREFQRAAELDPSETNLFDWGTELLTHGAPDPANEVFMEGIRLFPRSARMLIGSAVTLYAKGAYIDARRRFFEAADVNPGDSVPYLFLGKLQSREITESEGYLERLARFARLQPENAWANYYYGTALRAKQLLEKAVRLDPGLAPGYLQLGILYADEGDLAGAISAYKKAIETDPELEQAHYRLAQAYRQSGDAVRAQQEIAIFENLSKTSAQRLERERADLKQFVVTLKPKK
jgi:tetratricopeptide (TPR) repeat protein